MIIAEMLKYIISGEQHFREYIISYLKKDTKNQLLCNFNKFHICSKYCLNIIYFCLTSLFSFAINKRSSVQLASQLKSMTRGKLFSRNRQLTEVVNLAKIYRRNCSFIFYRITHLTIASPLALISIVQF